MFGVEKWAHGPRGCIAGYILHYCRLSFGICCVFCFLSYVTLVIRALVSAC